MVMGQRWGALHLMPSEKLFCQSTKVDRWDWLLSNAKASDWEYMCKV